MGAAADALAAARGISRERQDEYAARSHARTVAAAAAGRFAAELLPVAGLDRDERPRPGLDADRLGRLRPAFTPDGTATAGNSCGVSDGAAVVAVTSQDAATAAGLPHLRILGAAVTATDPALPGAASAGAIHRLLQGDGVRSRGITVGDIGAVEITEAFASVVLAVIDEVGLDAEWVCRDGGAIAMGHPWAASGAILLVRLAARMSGPDAPALGLAACAVGGGQGIAVLVERVDAGLL
jgi:acetyl-CoA C-acetyltransferase